MSKSPAEVIYSTWATKVNKFAVSEISIKSGEFHAFLQRNGFKPVIDGLIKLYQKNGLTTLGQRKTVEQMWKLLDKFKIRQGEVVAWELLKAMQTHSSLKSILEAFAQDYTPSFQTSDDDQRKIDAGRATWKALSTLYFPGVDKVVKMVKKLGQGGMGGAVYLGVDTKDAKDKYAVKHFPGTYESKKYNKLKIDDRELKQKILYDWDDERERFSRQKNRIRERIYMTVTGELLSPKGAADRVNTFLANFAEGALTTTCLDVIQRGADQFLLLALGEGDVDYADLQMADIINIFEDLDRIQNYSQNHMKVHITQDVGVLHLDVHGGNLMRFNGKMRFIDFGMALVYNPNTVEKFGRIKQAPWSEQRSDPHLYAHSNMIDDSLNYSDPNRGSAERYIEDWKSGYRVAPTVWVCRACKKQYPNVDLYTECFACGSKNVERASLRSDDIKSLARLNGKDPFDLLVQPHKDSTVKRITPVQYGCIVLTAVLIKQIWSAAQVKEMMDFGLGEDAASITNVNVYSKARRLFPQFQRAAPGYSLLIGLLLSWFDEMMLRLIKGDLFTAKDALRYFDRGRTRRERGRAAEI
jgi:serine/threonine protein kinase